MLMGKKLEKHFKENELFCFWGSERAVRIPISDLGGSDPVSTFGGETAQTSGSLPPKSRFSLAVFLQTHYGLVGLLGGPLSRRAAEREGYVSTRTLRVVSVLPR